jgi:hypothetical protein
MESLAYQHNSFVGSSLEFSPDGKVIVLLKAERKVD